MWMSIVLCGQLALMWAIFVTVLGSFQILNFFSFFSYVGEGHWQPLPVAKASLAVGKAAKASPRAFSEKPTEVEASLAGTAKNGKETKEKKKKNEKKF